MEGGTHGFPEVGLIEPQLGFPVPHLDSSSSFKNAINGSWDANPGWDRTERINQLNAKDRRANQQCFLVDPGEPGLVPFGDKLLEPLERVGVLTLERFTKGLMSRGDCALM